MRPDDGNTLYNATCVYGILGKKAEALETLRHAIQAGYANFDWVRRDPDLVCLKDEAEFHQLVGG